MSTAGRVFMSVMPFWMNCYHVIGFVIARLSRMVSFTDFFFTGVGIQFCVSWREVVTRSDQIRLISRLWPRFGSGFVVILLRRRFTEAVLSVLNYGYLVLYSSLGGREQLFMVQEPERDLSTRLLSKTSQVPRVSRPK